MKRLLCSLLLVLLWMAALPAAVAVTAEADVPDDVLAFYAADSYWDGWRIIGWANPGLPSGASPAPIRTRAQPFRLSSSCTGVPL